MSDVLVRTALYPDIEPFASGRLQVSEIHSVYYEQCGNKDGNPVIFLHGGPGSGCQPRDRTFFDPDGYHVVLMDQRGSGKSTPIAELKENTTWHLVEDIEQLRKHLNIEKWVVFGGSWGSTLALTYAESHPDSVKALVLRGVFTMRTKEILWLDQDGMNMIFPDEWERFVQPIPQSERHDMVGAYYRYLTSEDEEVRTRAAKAWSRWEMATARLQVDPSLLEKSENGEWAMQFARTECHYLVNKGFFETDSFLLDNVDKIRHIPGTIVQGRYDIICPMETAWQLHKRWPEAELQVVPDAGHNSREPGIAAMLVKACEKYKRL